MAKKITKSTTKKSARPTSKSSKPAASKSSKTAKVVKKVTKAVTKKVTKSVASKPAASPAPVASTSPLLGKPVPAFSLPSSSGGTFSTKDLAGRRAVLYFYPRADTPGCTKEACGFSDAITSYTSLGVLVAGISPDPIADVTKFAKKFNLKFPLLADEDHTVCSAFGVWVEKSMYGKKYFGAARTTFVISPKGTIEKVFEKVNPEGHDQEVLAYLKS